MTDAKRVDLYAMDLIWSIAKQYYDGLPKPSEIWTGIDTADHRTGDQIIDDLVNKLIGGE